MMPSVAALRNALSYDPETGVLLWKERVAMPLDAKMSLKEWNARFAGREAFTHVDGAGYRQGEVLGFHSRAHRVIWTIVTGEWPEGEVDHDDGQRSNNRWHNLRDVTHGENMKNCQLPKNNKSGVIGVFQSANGKRWVAQVTREGKRVHLGTFDTINEAAAARKAEADALGYHANHGRVLVCGSCERRADDAATKSCTHSDCGLAERHAA